MNTRKRNEQEAISYTGNTRIYGASTVVDGKTAFSIIGVKALQQGFPYSPERIKMGQKRGSDNKKKKGKGMRPDRD